MLVLTRKQYDTITIGRDIVIRIIKISHGQVQIGIAAPKDVKVLRGELVEHEDAA